MRSRWTFTIHFCVIAALTLPLCGLSGCEGCSKINDKPLEKFVIRLETPVTHIVSPVDDEGYVDYLEAANVRHAEGVTADNNFQVVVRSVFGPLEQLDEPSQREYYRRLGVALPIDEPEQGEYFQPLRRSGVEVSAVERIRDQQNDEIKGPWKATDYPELAEWIQAQSKHFDELVAGSHLPRNYIPYAMSAESHAQSVREIRGFWSGAQKSPDAAERLAARTVGEIIGGLSERSSPLCRFHANEALQHYRTTCRRINR